MSKIFRGLAAAFIFFMSVAVSSEAVEVMPINDLIENGRYYDKKTVAVQGEAIGEILEREDYAWVNINDKTNALGIWMPLKEAQKIQYFGDYKHKGDIVRITGTFHRACEEHGGDMDIHASTVEIVSRGNIVERRIASNKVMMSVILTLLTLIVSAIYFKATRA
jgi:hypothetical protein